MRAIFFSLMLVFGIQLRSAGALAPDAWCGTDGGELPDLWQQVVLEIEALEEVPVADGWAFAPGRVSALLGKLALLQRASVRQGTELMGAVRKTMNVAAGSRGNLIEAVNATNAAAYKEAVTALRAAVGALERRYPAGSLKMPPMRLDSKISIPTPTLFVKALGPAAISNQPMQVDLRLRDANGQGVGSLQLVEMHTRRLHALIIDPSLEDYHHEHPITSGRPGDFTFMFTPRRSGNYLLWLDVTPLATARNEMPQTIIGGTTFPDLPIRREVRLSSTNDGWRYELKLERKRIFAGESVGARLRVTQPDGRGCMALEPLMGAFAHIVGFMNDRQTMIHVHSHGEPPHELARSGPEIPFRFIAPKPGFLKLFVQVQVNGVGQLATFGLAVEDRSAPATAER